MEALINFECGQIRRTRHSDPRLLHEVYNIIPDTYETISQPDILIVEGINTLQLPANQQIYISDFLIFQFSWMPNQH